MSLPPQSPWVVWIESNCCEQTDLLQSTSHNSTSCRLAALSAVLDGLSPELSRQRRAEVLPPEQAAVPWTARPSTVTPDLLGATVSDAEADGLFRNKYWYPTNTRIYKNKWLEIKSNNFNLGLSVKNTPRATDGKSSRRRLPCSWDLVAVHALGTVKRQEQLIGKLHRACRLNDETQTPEPWI